MTNPGSDLLSQIAGIPTETLNYRSLFTRLQAGNTLITGNSRLSRILNDQYILWRSGLGDSLWPSPMIKPWNLWLDEIWELAALQGIAGTGRAVPGNRQLLSLWEQILNDEPPGRHLLHPEMLASQLRDTRKMVVEWRLDLKHPAWFDNENENYAAFSQWNHAFEKKCEKGHWISPEDRLQKLSDAIREGSLTVPGNIDFLGFDEFNPMQADLITALHETRHPVSCLAITSSYSHATLFESLDHQQELEHMARWVRYWVEKEPASQIAVVVPDLLQRRREVERHLQEVLIPGPGLQTKPWNTSLGIPLSKLPMIETAFDLLGMLNRRVDIQAVGRVLRSPWLRGATSEFNNRALLEKRLREKYPRLLKLEEVLYRAKEIRNRDRDHNELPKSQQGPEAWNSPQLANTLEVLLDFDKQQRGIKRASEWSELINNLLVRLGWPKPDPTSAIASETDHDISLQALKDWHEALRELATLDSTVTGLDRNNAVRQLRQICRDKVSQPHTPASPIQVLGLYEVNGLRFDHLWVLGLHGGNWPPGARINPFVPVRLQSAANTPHSSPQRELNVAQTITRRLLDTAPDCVFSYPGQIDGEATLPSPLLDTEEIGKENHPVGWQAAVWRKTVANGDKPLLGPLAGPGSTRYDTARGGSSILKNQALCPFRAYASNRLGAEGLETPSDGISPALHGSLVHEVLEAFWKETTDQHALLLMDETKLETRVRKHVERVTMENRGLKQRPAFRSVEADRVFRHVMAFLTIEKQRDRFVVAAFEKKVLFEIEGQTIRLYIDRVDRLADGEEVIIDYKTGKVAPKKWFGDRPEDPQLPLYAISAEKTPAGVVFGIIREDGCEYKGVVGKDGLLPGLPPKANKSNEPLIDAGHQMAETIDEWRVVLHRLMADFLAGVATVDPKRGRKTCRESYCELQPLCRINELEQFLETDRQEALQ